MLVLLAQTPGTPTGPEFGKASPLGLVIILVLLAGTVLLVRSMNRHIKGLPATFEPEHPEPDQAADEGTEPGIARLDKKDVESDEGPDKI
ncbi:hypothetical protein OG563_12180 [Nocardia vinacea]|uniref:Secreted protein n=1 Tax=Nocardia vinacea TaxID=96468 RepID=A0ABZ1Z445_9NOCA|nr:hypothetical protein [Nocardia vinacea]